MATDLDSVITKELIARMREEESLDQIRTKGHALCMQAHKALTPNEKSLPRTVVLGTIVTLASWFVDYPLRLLILLLALIVLARAWITLHKAYSTLRGLDGRFAELMAERAKFDELSDLAGQKKTNCGLLWLAAVQLSILSVIFLLGILAH